MGELIMSSLVSLGNDSFYNQIICVNNITIFHNWAFFVKRNLDSMQRMTLKGAGLSWPFLDYIGLLEDLW